MRSRLFAGLVCGGCTLALAGCSPAPESPPAGPAAASPVTAAPATDGAIAQAVDRPASEPEVRYLPLDAPPGSSRAVVVQGLPLVHTRQLLPLDAAGQLVGGNSPEQQTKQVLANLSAVLQSAGSGLEQLIKLNVYADSLATAERVQELLRSQLVVHPAQTAVVSPLPHPGALVALDAIATAGERRATEVALLRSEAVAGHSERADAAILPAGGVVYLSGQAEKGSLADATASSLKTLLNMLPLLGLGPEQVVQLKVFVQPAAAAEKVAGEIQRLFPGRLTPPLVFVEWIASSPVEIELIAYSPLSGNSPESVRHYNPPDVKASPTFSRAAVVQSDRQIYVGGLTARTAGDGQAQVRDIFVQLQEILAAAGSDLEHLAKATYYVSDEDASTALNKLRPEYFDPQRPPAASKATVHGVGQADRTLSLDMIACPVR